MKQLFFLPLVLSIAFKTHCQVPHVMDSLNIPKMAIDTTFSRPYALIAGGSKGIGFGIAKILLENGMRVAITSRSLKASKTAADSLSKDVSKILALESNVSSLVSEVKAIKETIDRFGQLDVVIANAGVGLFAAIDNMTEQQWKETIDTNLTGVFNSVKASIDELKKSKGYIITIASLAGTNFFENGAAYNASKFGLVGFSQAKCLI